MARVDSGNYGNSVAPPVEQAVRQPRAAFDTSGIQAASEGLTRVAIADKANRQDREAEEFAARERTRRELEQKEGELERARSAAALVDYDLAVREAGASVTQDLTTGKIAREDVGGAFEKLEGEARAAALSSIGPDSQEFVGGRLAKAAGRIRLGLDKAVEVHRQNTILGYAESIRDSMAKLAVEPGADLGKIQAEFADAAGVLMKDGGADNRLIGKAVQDFRDKTTVDYLVARMNERMESYPGLKALKGEISDAKKYPHLDPEKRNTLLHSVNAAMARLENKIQADQNRILAELQTDLTNAEKVIKEGYVPSPEQLVALERRAKGTPLEAHYKRLSQTAAYVGQFTNAPLGTMEAELIRLDKEVRKAPTPEGVSMVSAMRGLVDSKKKGLTDDAYGQAVKDGAPFAQLDFSSQENLAAAVSSRVAAVKGQAAANPGSGQGIFLEGEARAFKAFLETQPAQQQAALLGQFSQAVKDPVVLSHTMRQVSKESPILGHAGVLASMGHLEAAEAALDGNAIMTSKDGKVAVQLPADSKFQSEWRDRVGNAYAGKPEAEDLDYQTAKAIYASLARKEGKTAQTDVATKIWRQAIDMATGGTAEYNDTNIVLPYGLSSSEFRKRAHRAIDMAFAAGSMAHQGKPGKRQEGLSYEESMVAVEKAKRDYAKERGAVYGPNSPLPPDWEDTTTGGQLTRDYIKDLPLENVGTGKYRVRQGSQYVTNDEGFPIVLDLNQDPPTFSFDRQRVKRPIVVDPESGAATRGMVEQAIPPGKPISGNPEPLDKVDMGQDRKGQ